MTRPLLVRPEAESDLSEAFDWYESRVPGLGGQFLLCVDAVLAAIQRSPKAYAILYKGVVRRALTRRFPYAVFFIDEEDRIVVLGVIHCKRNPRVWRRRVP